MMQYERAPPRPSQTYPAPNPTPIKDQPGRTSQEDEDTYEDQ